MQKPVGELPSVARNSRLLVDIEVFQIVLTELNIESRGVPNAAAADGRVMGRNLAFPFWIEQVTCGAQFVGIDGARIDVERGGDGAEQAQDVHFLRIGEP